MKRFSFIFLFILSFSISKAQTIPIDTLVLDIATMINEIDHRITARERYKLYPTENLYTFLQLDTKTGEIEQVQWSLDDKNEFSISINSLDLSLETGSGTFELYPTKNMYQFLLLDKTNGRKWHVQWGMKSSERWIRRIN